MSCALNAASVSAARTRYGVMLSLGAAPMAAVDWPGVFSSRAEDALAQHTASVATIPSRMNVFILPPVLRLRSCAGALNVIRAARSTVLDSPGAGSQDPAMRNLSPGGTRVWLAITGVAVLALLAGVPALRAQNAPAYRVDPFWP